MTIEKKTAVELAGLLAAGQTTAAGLAEACLRHADEAGGFVTTSAEAALRTAGRVDARRGAGEALPPLAGVPVGVEDSFCTEGVLTACGSAMLKGFIPPYSATAVTRLEAGGLPLLGKLAVGEFGLEPDGPCGAVLAVAQGALPLALGSDHDGALRRRAGDAGLVSLKPTWGAISRYGLVSAASSLDQAAPVARSVMDCALLFDLLAGPDPLDASTCQAPHSPVAPSLDGEVGHLHIALVRELQEAAGPASAAALSAAEALVVLGATCREAALPLAALGPRTHYILASAEASSNLARLDGIKYGHRAQEAEGIGDLIAKSRAEGFGPELRRRTLLGTYALLTAYRAEYYDRAVRLRAALVAACDELLADCDLLLTPLRPAAGYGEALDREGLCTVLANLAGLPALVLPFGGGALQLIGKRGSEALLLNAALALESLERRGS
ncbi:MAG: Asp-tRNA(Asn)/Glu-tRNA(Gln) amidotransferase subunit GatA [Clostridiales bacterium]|nr:Asp-tRNA(Asn)/Glu-tRNA(Gln) amidotransferase subunit GatA [Clostridiales bacterium]